MGILEVLTIVFVVLKVLGLISWSWWLVFLPLIISAVIYVCVWSFYGAAIFKMNKKFDDDFFK